MCKYRYYLICLLEQNNQIMQQCQQLLYKFIHWSIDCAQYDFAMPGYAE
jgi:hypothetical protein